MRVVEERCSFCGRPRSEVRALVAGKAAMICDACASWAKSADAAIAFCATCTPVRGWHAANCLEKGIA
jgi:hypothetical protein